MTTVSPPTANDVLAQFDRVEANLNRLEKLWGEIERLTPEGVRFGGEAAYDNACRSFDQIADALPAIDGFRIAARPWDLDAIAQSRLDAWEIDEVEAKVSVERSIEEPGRETAEYRFRFESKRRALVRQLVGDVFRGFEENLRALVALGYPVDDDRPLTKLKEWSELCAHVEEIERLAGSALPATQAWTDLRRHLHFGMPCDLSDIAQKDWPAARAAIEQALYSDREPLPVAVADLSELLRAKPTGRVVARLAWERLDADGFERLIFALLCGASDYENVQWLMRTHAPDRGRDLSATRVRDDSIAGAQRMRVIIQCKHWLTRSVDVAAVSEAAAQVRLWEPPPVDVLVIATSGRFTSDAVSWIERRRDVTGERPAIEMWPESHLEQVLWRRPDLIAIHNLSPA